MALYFIIGGLTVSVIAILCAYMNFEYAKSWRKSNSAWLQKLARIDKQTPESYYPTGNYFRNFVLKLICWAGILSTIGGFIAYFLK